MRRVLPWKQYLAALGFVAGAGVLAKVLQHVLTLPDPALVFLSGVLGTAVLCGLGPSILAAFASLVVYDVFFVDPLYTLTVDKPQDVVSLVVFLVVGILTSNLTARLRNQEGILEEKAKTEAVMAAIEDGLIVLDPAGMVVHVNDVACAVLEVERSEVTGRRFDDLATRHPHYLRVRAAVREFLAHPDRAGDRVEITLFLRGRDHYFLLRPTRVSGAHGSPGGLILVLQDVTYLRDQEAHREALVATLSHELRTPITSLSMAHELLLRMSTNLSAEQSSLLETVGEDVARLQDVTQRLLDLSRSRATTIALDRSSVDLREVATRVTRIFNPQARDKGIVLHVAIPEDGLTIFADPTKLTWAVSNLLSNALRYTPTGGRIDVEIELKEESVSVMVSDTGPGIPPEHRERVFERYAQVGDTGDIGSAGLGLAIVRDIVQAHGGRIHVESAVGCGSRFVLQIPRG